MKICVHHLKIQFLFTGSIVGADDKYKTYARKKLKNWLNQEN